MSMPAGNGKWVVAILPDAFSTTIILSGHIKNSSICLQDEA